MLSRSVNFSSKEQALLISWLQSLSAVILEPEIKSYVTVPTVSPPIWHGVMGMDTISLGFWMLSFLFIYFFFVVDFVIHWNETAKGLHVFPMPIPPPTSLSTHSL